MLGRARSSATVLAVGVLVVVGASCSRGPAARPLTRTDLGTLGGEGSAAEAIDAHRRVVGTSETASGAAHAFVWDPSSRRMTDLGTLGGPSSAAHDISDAGIVVGTADDAEGHPRAMAYDLGRRVMTDLGTLGGAVSGARGVNERGQVVGFSQTADGAFHAFVHDLRTGVMTDLGTLGGTHSAAFDINEAGQVVGESDVTGDGATHAFRFDPTTGSTTDLGTLGGNGSTAQAINDAGVVVGSSGTVPGQSGYRPFVHDPRVGTMVEIPTPGGSHSSASDINDGGLVVGDGATGVETPARGFVRRRAGRVETVEGPADASTYTAANPAGDVVGSAAIGGGPRRAVLYTTAPLDGRAADAEHGAPAPDPAGDGRPTDDGEPSAGRAPGAGTRWRPVAAAAVPGAGATPAPPGSLLLLVLGGGLLVVVLAGSRRRPPRPDRRWRLLPVGVVVVVAAASLGPLPAAGPGGAAAPCDCAALAQDVTSAQETFEDALAEELAAHEALERDRPALEDEIAAAAEALAAAPSASEVEALRVVAEETVAERDRQQEIRDRWEQGVEDLEAAGHRLVDLSYEAVKDLTYGSYRDARIYESIRWFTLALYRGTAQQIWKRAIELADSVIRVAKRAWVVGEAALLMAKYAVAFADGAAAYAEVLSIERDGGPPSLVRLDELATEADRADAALRAAQAERAAAQDRLDRAEEALERAEAAAEEASQAAAAAEQQVNEALDALAECNAGGSGAPGCEPDCAGQPRPPGCRPSEGGDWGDPHLITFDGPRYDFHAEGELVVVESTVDDLAVHAVQRFCCDDRVAYNDRVAIRAGGDVVTFSANGPTTVNGQPAPPGSTTLPGGATFDGETLATPDGTEVEVTGSAWRGTEMLHVDVELSPGRAGLVRGLLGDADGDATAERAVPADDLEVLYDEWGPAQQTDDADRILDGPRLPYRPPSDAPPTLADLDPDLVAGAAQACRDRGWPVGEALATCTYDVAVTGVEPVDDPDLVGLVDDEAAGESLNGPTADDLAAAGVGFVPPGEGIAVYGPSDMPATGPLNVLVDVDEGDVLVVDGVAEWYCHRGYDPEVHVVAPSGATYVSVCKEGLLAVPAGETGTWRVVIEAPTDPSEWAVQLAVRRPRLVPLDDPDDADVPPGEIVVFQARHAGPDSLVSWTARDPYGAHHCSWPTIELVVSATVAGPDGTFAQTGLCPELTSLVDTMLPSEGIVIASRVLPDEAPGEDLAIEVDAEVLDAVVPVVHDDVVDVHLRGPSWADTYGLERRGFQQLAVVLAAGQRVTITPQVCPWGDAYSSVVADLRRERFRGGFEVPDAIATVFDDTTDGCRAATFTAAEGGVHHIRLRGGGRTDVPVHITIA